MRPTTSYARGLCIFFLGIVFGLFGEAQAGTIIGLSAVPGSPGLGTIFGSSFVTPNANDFPGPGESMNTVAIGKGFEASKYIDMNFTVANSTGVTRYYFTETIANGTGDTWNDFQFTLGYFTGAKFVKSNLMDGLDFDVKITGGKEDPTKPIAPNPTSDMFPNNTNRTDPNMITYSGEDVGAAIIKFNFTIDVPDFDKANMPDGIATAGNNGYNFTLREIPSVKGAVPEPSSLTLFAVGSILVGYVMRRRKRT